MNNQLALEAKSFAENLAAETEKEFNEKGYVDAKLFMIEKLFESAGNRDLDKGVFFALVVSNLEEIAFAKSNSESNFDKKKVLARILKFQGIDGNMDREDIVNEDLEQPINVSRDNYTDLSEIRHLIESSQSEYLDETAFIEKGTPNPIIEYFRIISSSNSDNSFDKALLDFYMEKLSPATVENLCKYAIKSNPKFNNQDPEFMKVARVLLGLQQCEDLDSFRQNDIPKILEELFPEFKNPSPINIKINTLLSQGINSFVTNVAAKPLIEKYQDMMFGSKEDINNFIANNLKEIKELISNPEKSQLFSNGSIFRLINDFNEYCLKNEPALIDINGYVEFLKNNKYDNISIIQNLNELYFTISEKNDPELQSVLRKIKDSITKFSEDSQNIKDEKLSDETQAQIRRSDAMGIHFLGTEKKSAMDKLKKRYFSDITLDKKLKVVEEIKSFVNNNLKDVLKKNYPKGDSIPHDIAQGLTFARALQGKPGNDMYEQYINVINRSIDYYNNLERISQNDDDKDPYIAINSIILAWMATKDPKALEGELVDPQKDKSVLAEELKEQICMRIFNAAFAYSSIGGGRNPGYGFSCFDGVMDRMVDALDGSHQDVTVLFNPAKIIPQEKIIDDFSQTLMASLKSAISNNKSSIEVMKSCSKILAANNETLPFIEMMKDPILQPIVKATFKELNNSNAVSHKLSDALDEMIKMDPQINLSEGFSDGLLRAYGYSSVEELINKTCQNPVEQSNLDKVLKLQEEIKSILILKNNEYDAQRKNAKSPKEVAELIAKKNALRSNPEILVKKAEIDITLKSIVMQGLLNGCGNDQDKKQYLTDNFQTINQLMVEKLESNRFIPTKLDNIIHQRVIENLTSNKFDTDKLSFPNGYEVGLSAISKILDDNKNALNSEETQLIRQLLSQINIKSEVEVDYLLTNLDKLQDYKVKDALLTCKNKIETLASRVPEALPLSPILEPKVEVKPKIQKTEGSKPVAEVHQLFSKEIVLKNQAVNAFMNNLEILENISKTAPEYRGTILKIMGIDEDLATNDKLNALINAWGKPDHVSKETAVKIVMHEPLPEIIHHSLVLNKNIDELMNDYKNKTIGPEKTGLARIWENIKNAFTAIFYPSIYKDNLTKKEEAKNTIQSFEEIKATTNSLYEDFMNIQKESNDNKDVMPSLNKSTPRLVTQVKNHVGNAVAENDSEVKVKNENSSSDRKYDS